MKSSIAKLPLTFELNQGQTDAQVKFLSHGNGYNLFLTPQETVLSLTKPAQKKSKAINSALKMKLIGANDQAMISGANELPGKTNYFLGNDPGKWRTNIPTYAKVKSSSVYPGVDLLYYGNQNQLEYDFIVAPRTDPNIIKLHYEGAQKIFLNKAGDLIFQTAAGKVTQKKPSIYQTINGIKLDIKGRYILTGKEVSFEVGAYNKSEPLIIDPIVYATYLGGTSFGYGSGITVDAAGNAYVTGRTYARNFPITAGAYQTSNPIETSVAFISKLDPTGEHLLYSTYLGAVPPDGNWRSDTQANAIAVDANGSASITGWTSSHYFPLTAIAGAIESGNLGTKCFVSRLSPDGTQLLFSIFIPSNATLSMGNAMDVDTSGNLYIAGLTYADSQGYSSNGYQVQPPTGANAFLVKVNPFATVETYQQAIPYYTYFGGSGEDEARALKVDGSGNVVIAGKTTSTDLPISPTAAQATAAAGESDAFVAKFDTRQSGAASFLYGSYLGGNNADEANAVTVNAAGEIIVTGATKSTNFPLTNSYPPLTNSLASGAFTTKIDPSQAGTSGLKFSYIFITGGFDYHGRAVGVDAAGNYYVAAQRFIDSTTQLMTFKADDSGFKDSASIQAGTNALYVNQAGDYYLTGIVGSNFPTSPTTVVQ